MDNKLEASPWRRHLPHSYHSQVSYSFCLGLEPCKNSPFCVSMLIGVSFVQVLCGQPCLHLWSITKCFKKLGKKMLRDDSGNKRACYSSEAKFCSQQPCWVVHTPYPFSCRASDIIFWTLQVLQSVHKPQSETLMCIFVFKKDSVKRKFEFIITLYTPDTVHGYLNVLMSWVCNSILYCCVYIKFII